MRVNANFHSLWGEKLHTGQGKYAEYRRKWLENPQKYIVGDFPLFVDIETSCACNLSCHFCGIKHDGGIMDPGVVRRIIDEGARSGLYGVKLSLRGEPLLNEHLPELARYAVDSGLVDVYFNTNGLLLTHEICQRLVGAGLNRISISCEGYDNESYKQTRGGDFERLVHNIQVIREMVGRPKIRMQAVLVEGFDLDKYVGFWKDRVDEICYLDRQDRHGSKKLVSNWACQQLWQRLGVLWDGTIVACCCANSGEPRIGHINDTSLWDAWHSDRLNTIRKYHMSGMAHKIAGCDYCPIRYQEVSSG